MRSIRVTRTARRSAATPPSVRRTVFSSPLPVRSCTTTSTRTRTSTATATATATATDRRSAAAAGGENLCRGRRKLVGRSPCSNGTASETSTRSIAPISRISASATWTRSTESAGTGS